MSNYVVEFRVELSPYAYDFYKQITKDELVIFIACLSKLVTNSRYRDFSQKPIFCTDSSGKRVVVRAREKKKNYHNLKFNLPIGTLDAIKQLQSLGHSLSWIIEESLYYGLQQRSK